MTASIMRQKDLFSHTIHRSAPSRLAITVMMEVTILGLGGPCREPDGLPTSVEIKDPGFGSRDSTPKTYRAGHWRLCLDLFCTD